MGAKHSTAGRSHVNARTTETSCQTERSETVEGTNSEKLHSPEKPNEFGNSRTLQSECDIEEDTIKALQEQQDATQDTPTLIQAHVDNLTNDVEIHEGINLQEKNAMLQPTMSCKANVLEVVPNSEIASIPAVKAYFNIVEAGNVPQCITTVETNTVINDFNVTQKSSQKGESEARSVQFGNISRPAELLTFSLEDFNKAPLVCVTSFERGWKLNFGFTAENIFFKTNELKGFSSEWIHDEGVFRLRSYMFQGIKNVKNSVKRDAMRLDVKYSSFVKINFEIEDVKQKSDLFNVKVTFVVEHPPFVFLEKQDISKRNDRIDCGRFYHQVYHEIIKGYWTDLIDASAFQLTYEMKKDTFESWMSQIYSTIQCPVEYNHLQIECFNRDGLSEIQMTKWPWDTRYYVECIRRLGIVGKFFLNYRLFSCGELNILKYSNDTVTADANRILQSMYYFVKHDRSLPSLRFTPANYIIPRPLGRDYVAIKTAYITPTRYVYDMEEPTVNNRGFRKLDAERKILQVKFRDEDLSWFPRDEHILKDRMLNPLFNGLNVEGRSFFGFASSSSLFREHGLYFYATERQEDIVEIIKEWAKFKTEPAAKTAARLGQYFTSAKEIKEKLNKSEIGYLPDFEYDGIEDSNGKKYCFSDGCGIIDPEYAQHIQAELGLSYTPSAFQIRCLGCKGMVSVDYGCRQLKSNGGSHKVIFRPSQEKFKAVDKKEIDFDVVQFSAPSPVKLHRSFIALLIALARDQEKEEAVESRLHELLTESFMDIIKALTIPEAFLKILESLPRYFPVSELPVESLINEPFLRSLVEAYVVFVAKLLNNKCQIPLPDSLGRCALGIVDTTGLLHEGEIFFQYTVDIRSKAANPQRIVHEGPIGITKSPMYHLGDIRYVTAVNHPELHHLYDVVVFPGCGSRPIPDQIGGGDLDGDTYVLFFDLLLEHAAAADYLAADTSGIPNVTLEELHPQHANFRVEYELHNNLEQLSNCHVNHLTTQHPNHPDVERIAQKCDVGVNYFKSGLPAAELDNSERHVYSPIYMEKRHEPAYTSSHILCQLHKRCNTFYNLVLIALQQAQKQRSERQPQKLDVSDDSTNMYLAYKTEIFGLMKRYKIRSEAELFADVFIEIPGVFNTFKLTSKEEQEAVTSEIRATLTNIFKGYRIQLLNKFYPDWESDMKSKNETFFSYKIPVVSDEMRKVAKEFYNIAQNDGECLSFPWLIFEGLELGIHRNQPSLVQKLTADIKGHRLPYELARLSSAFFDTVYTGFGWFAVTVEAWLDKEAAYKHFKAETLINMFSEHLLKNNEDPSVTKKTFADAFLHFLTMICSYKFKKIKMNAPLEGVYKAAQSTLIEMAFTPDLPIVKGTSLQHRTIPYPAFVISVPKMYSRQFQERYRELLNRDRHLKNLEMVVRIRKQTMHFCNFTICCRGTLSQCQTLEALLTPNFEFENDLSVSMADMKVLKTQTMQALLKNLFNPPLEDFTRTTDLHRPYMDNMDGANRNSSRTASGLDGSGQFGLNNRHL